MNDLAASILAALPHTQCTRCGYPDCAAYAQALAAGAADINQCPPGGAEGVDRLAALTRRPALPLNPANGQEGPRSVVFIDETWCIGCTLCIKACPVDAIVGANKRMHTVLEAYCTGCELCLPVCPVDCILVENASGQTTGWAAWSGHQAEQAGARYARHQERCIREQQEDDQHQQTRAALTLADLPTPAKGASGAEMERKRAVIEAAMARAKSRRRV